MDPVPMPYLPAEVWLMILERLPPSFFQQDIRRLTLSKRWYSLAFPTFYTRIEFTPRVISRLVHRKSRSLDKSRAQLRKSLRSVNIVLDGLPGVNGSSRSGGGGADIACFNTPANLARFCVMLLEFRELKEVRFAARWPNRAWRADPLQGNYLHLRSVEPYLTLLTHVTALDLDLCGTDVAGDAATTALHFCGHVRPLLSRLRSLRLRMRSICHLALRPLDDGRPVTLAELRLSLYLGRVSENNPKLNASRTCPYWASWERTVPMDEMRARMRALVKQMVEPKRAELVHLAPSGDVHVWDASTGVCVKDESEKPMKFHPYFEGKRSRSCFHKHADDWQFDDEVGVGGIFTSYPDEESDEDET
ncbi:predicted protein [Chaetomium globosum CBS 148.51]|uniref:Uncharacterized protein n=1 Tax=Chaetomium globosum (strain ATCC 6205 / CBS 148.51 / DSM 1962 / NBRC 6347 / NRRL 1970) TaxID=306901 RepID=Q2GUU8_CHAGB|nr:uncharacterized protein CHGG_08256 [Chaetomium globosum CBS 148.51]EAQ87003.1 predicted protein [Chaetomium globosum CBS 148.51]